MRGASVGGLLLVGLFAGCGVDRDLSPSRFACAQGGPCDGGGAPGDGGGLDAGPDGGGLDLSACVGTYSGIVSSGDLGTVEGVLVADGRLSFTFTTLRHPTALRVTAQVGADRSITNTAPSALITGTFDEVRCAAQGNWTENGTGGGAWNLDKE